MRRTLLTLLVGLSVIVPTGAIASSNDDRADARPMRFHGGWHSVDIPRGSVEPGEDLSCLDAVDQGTPLTTPQTFWFLLQPDADLTAEVRAYGQRQGAPTGLGIFEQGASTPFACGTPNGQTVLRMPLEGGSTYELQVSCQCDTSGNIIGGGFITAAIVPPNDELANAAEVSVLPFGDHPFLSVANTDNHAYDCDLPGHELEGTVGDPPEILYRSTRNVWYRYEAPDEQPLFVEVFRYSSPHLNVYVEADDQLELLQCRGPETRTGEYEAFRLYTRALVEVVAGRTYYFEVMEGNREPSVADVYVAHAERTDMSLDDIRVGPPISATNSSRRVEIDVGANGHAGPATMISLLSCPPGGPEASCVLVGETHASWLQFFGGPGTVVIDWDTAGCVGDVELRAVLSSPYTADPEDSNDRRSTIMSLEGGSYGVGGGPCLLYNWLWFIPR